LIFNIQTCEQLNGWLGGFESILKRMTQTNFKWFLHVMLFYYTQQVIAKQANIDTEEVDDLLILNMKILIKVVESLDVI